MQLLTWLSVVILLILMGVFAFWLWRENRPNELLLRRFFYGGTAVFFLLFLAFSWNSLEVIKVKTHEDALTPQVVAGKEAWQKYVCIDCHTIEGIGAYYAPELTRAYSRFVDRSGGNKEVARGVLASFIQNPPRATSQRRGMPFMGISNEEAANLVAFLEWQANSDLNGWPPAPLFPLRQAAATAVVSPPTEAAAMHGKEMFEKSGCTGCHTIGQGTLVGPDLLGIGKKYDEKTLLQWIEDPETVYSQRGQKPINPTFPEMPRPEISVDDARAIVAYLISTERKEE